MVNEEAYCYVEGSLCEKWYRRSRYHPRKHQTTGNNGEGEKDDEIFCLFEFICISIYLCVYLFIVSSFLGGVEGILRAKKMGVEGSFNNVVG